MVTNLSVPRTVAILLTAGLALAGCKRGGDDTPIAAGRSRTPASTAAAAGDNRERKEPERKTAEAAREREEARERGGAPDEDSEEARENAEELKMRERALAALQAYRAPTCAEGIAKIETLLRSGKGRWLERDQHGAIPTDLLQALTQAELWSAQSESVCKSDPQHLRFDSLHLLMATMWQYPRTASRAMLEAKLRVLDE